MKCQTCGVECGEPPMKLGNVARWCGRCAAEAVSAACGHPINFESLCVTHKTSKEFLMTQARLAITYDVLNELLYASCAGVRVAQAFETVMAIVRTEISKPEQP